MPCKVDIPAILIQEMGREGGQDANQIKAWGTSVTKGHVRVMVGQLEMRFGRLTIDDWLRVAARCSIA
jgi:hypothetical protein